MSTIPPYTLDGSPALKARLQQAAAAALAGVRAKVPPARLGGVLVGGAHGRGEGGVLRGPAGEQPYHDLEIFVLAGDRYQAPVRELGPTLSATAGLPVVCRLLPPAALRQSPPTIEYYELVSAHHWLAGDDQLLAGCDHHREAAQIPLAEATRLLLNACSGLLLAQTRLRAENSTPADAATAGRYLAQAQLALGDVLLAAHGEYHWSTQQRGQNLDALVFSTLPWVAPIKAHHAAGVACHRQPQPHVATRAELEPRLQELIALGEKLWLWLESRRLEHRFGSTRDYALSGLDKCPETFYLHNHWLNGRHFGLSGFFQGRHPRERLLNTLPLLLWEKNAPKGRGLLGALQTELRTDARELPALVAAYAELWERLK